MPGSKQLKEEQKDMIRQAWGRKRVMICSPAGSGKTLTALALFYFYKASGHKKKMLVFAHSKGWGAFPRDNQFGFKMKVIVKTSDMDHYIAHMPEYWDQYDVIVVNTYLLSDYYSGLFPKENSRTRRKVKTGRDAFVRTAQFCDFVVLDEVHRYRTEDNKDNLTLVQFFAAYRGFALYMTATLFYTDLLNTYNIFRYVDPTIFPAYWPFYERYVRYIEIPMSLWREGPDGRRYRQEIVRKEKIGYKNQNELLAKIQPFLIVKMNTEWTFNWNIVPYTLTDEEQAGYWELIKGLGLNDNLIKVSLETLDHKKKILRLAKTDTVISADGSKVLSENVHVGMYVLDGNHKYVAKKVEEIGDEASFSARLPALQKFLSRSTDKARKLEELIKAKGALVYCQYHETANSLAKDFKVRYPGRKISVLTGATTNVADKIKDHSDDEIIFCTRAITESLNFYFKQIIIYESVTSPGMLDQYVGRASRGDADYRTLDVYVFIGSRTIDMYFWERLIQSVNALDTNQFADQLPHSPDWPWVVARTNSDKVSYKTLKVLLLWRESFGKAEDEEEDEDNEFLDGEHSY